ncbi:glycosyltransferase family 2 protein [Limosilactobacillus vaginalis]|uniref:glycosyltransferase family 2 protein n=1 Tax=Limosilactobacillus vaginalis TaxID=1633 RepID=UPI001F09BF89|nr:glycosyltransferase family 2 protein [Limosilactobacillus vaginalis]
MKSKLSIIIPTYNDEKTIIMCLDSILKSFCNCITDIEIIVVNDGSYDGTLKVLEKFNRLNLIKLVTEKNLGVSSARNLGLSIAKGKYVWFIDADDHVCDFNGKKILKYIMEYNSDLYIFGFKKIYHLSNGDKKIVYEGNPYLKKYNKRNVIKKFSNIFNENEFNVPWNKIYKKSVIDKNNISFIIDMKSGEDAAFNCDYMINCKSLCVLPDVLINYNIRKINSRNYNATYYKDTRIMLLKIKMLTRMLDLDNAFLSNKIVEINKGIIDNIFIKYSNINLNIKSIFKDVNKEVIKDKVDFGDLTKKNKIKYILFNTYFGIWLRCISLKLKNLGS